MKQQAQLNPVAMGVSALLAGGMVYTVELVRQGQVIDSEQVHNLMPIEGRDHMLGVCFKGVAPAQTWCIGLFEANAFPTEALTAATFNAALTECVAYTPAVRPTFVAGATANGALDNTTSRAEFTFTAAKNVYGAFLISSPTKGGASGVLMSVARFASRKAPEIGDTLRVTAAFQLLSADI